MGTGVQSTLHTQASIESSLKSLISVVERQKLDQDEGLSKSLERLKARVASKEISLAVLGEFSAGKTTFINTLLNTNILDTGILPTTAVCTYISYGSEPSCEVLLKSGERLRVNAGEVAKFSVEGARAAEVSEVRLKLPSALLSQGLVIVDTPGFNVNIDEHEAITRGAIGQANACLYLMDARQPGKKTTVDFLRRIHGAADKFFFVLNRADILDADEQQEALEFVSAALEQECGIPQPRVVLVSSSFERATDAEKWRSRLQEFDQELRHFMQTEREAVVAAELARLLDRAIGMSAQLLESKHRLIEQELAAHYRVSLPDAAEIVAALREQNEAALDVDCTVIRRRFLELQEVACRDLRSEVESCISSTRSTQGLVESAPAKITKSFEEHAFGLQQFLSTSFETVFSMRQAQVAATVTNLLAGVKWLEQKAFLSRPAPWLSGLAGAALVFGVELLLAPPILALILSPILGAALGFVIYGAWYWTANRHSFSAPVIASLADAGYVQGALATGSLYQDVAANPIEPNSAPVHIGRGLGNVTGNPVFAIAGAAIAVGAFGFRLLMDKVSGRLDKLRDEIRQNVAPLLDEFEAKTKDSGLVTIDAGKHGLASALSAVLDNSVERYQVILDRLLKPHRRIRESLERRNNEIRADHQVLRDARQQVLDGLRVLETRLKGTPSRSSARPADSFLHTSYEAPPRDRVKLLELDTAEMFPRSTALRWAWIASLAVVLVIGMVSWASVNAAGRAPDAWGDLHDTTPAPAAAPAPAARAAAVPPAQAIVVTPTRLEFTPTAIGDASEIGVVKVRNAGSVTTRISSYALSAPFVFVKDTCVGKRDLAPGQECEISLVFVPATTGTFTTSLYQPVDDGLPVVAELVGTGIERADGDKLAEDAVEPAPEGYAYYRSGPPFNFRVAYKQDVLTLGDRFGDGAAYFKGLAWQTGMMCHGTMDFNSSTLKALSADVVSRADAVVQDAEERPNGFVFIGAARTGSDRWVGGCTTNATTAACCSLSYDLSLEERYGLAAPQIMRSLTLESKK